MLKLFGKEKRSFFFWEDAQSDQVLQSFLYIRKIVKFKKEKQQPNMHVLKRGYKITHNTHRKA
jgi:hypothetical protein